ncbi:MAG TPA: sel1 repeat family protein [Motiliproteus sp.]
MLSRVLLKAFAPLFFWVAHAAFRSAAFRHSARKHRWVMSTFRLAADVGYCRALSVYGYLLFLRGDSAQSKIQGGIYLEQAARKGDMKAQYQMGKIYEEGFEFYFRADPAKALHYYRSAAVQGHSLAITRLADAAANGELGLQPDGEEARRWRALMPG